MLTGSPNYSGLKKIGAYSPPEMEVLKEALMDWLAAEEYMGYDC